MAGIKSCTETEHPPKDCSSSASLTVHSAQQFMHSADVESCDDFIFSTSTGHRCMSNMHMAWLRNAEVKWTHTTFHLVSTLAKVIITFHSTLLASTFCTCAAVFPLGRADCKQLKLSGNKHHDFIHTVEVEWKF